MKKEVFDTESFILKSKKIHGEDRFDYSESVYEGYYTEVKILCKEHQEYFYQQPANHFNSVGCKYCIDKGYSRDKSGYIYINSVCDGVVKVGITNVCPIERAKVLDRKSVHSIRNLFYFYHEDGNFIYNLEQHILKTFETGLVSKKEMSSGYTETISSEYLPEIIDTIVYWFTNNTS